jgi:hypothetical protein
MEIVNREGVEAFITKDTSIIREILAPRNSLMWCRYSIDLPPT